MLLIIFIFGLMIGSFLNVCAYRVPKGLSIVTPPSACTHCSTRLTAPDLVPVFSYMFLRGKCRHCGGGISPKYPLVELVTGVLFVIIYLFSGYSVLFPAYAFLGVILLLVFLVDLELMIIPDEFVISGLVGGVAFQVWSITTGRTAWWDGLAGVLAGSGVLMLIAVLSEKILKKEGMGGGDIKLMAVVGLFLGLKLTLLCIFLSAALGAAIGLILLKLKARKVADAGLPFGPFIALGAFISLFGGNRLIEWYVNSFLQG